MNTSAAIFMNSPPSFDSSLDTSTVIQLLAGLIAAFGALAYCLRRFLRRKQKHPESNVVVTAGEAVLDTLHAFSGQREKSSSTESTYPTSSAAALSDTSASSPLPQKSLSSSNSDPTSLSPSSPASSSPSVEHNSESEH